MSIRILTYASLLIAAAALAGCRKDLCYDYHPTTFDVIVEVDCSEMDIPQTLMRVDFYSKTTGERYTRLITPERDIVKLPIGTYNSVIFNDNSDVVSYSGSESLDTYKALMPYLSRGQYNMLYGGRQVAYSSMPAVVPPDFSPAMPTGTRNGGSVSTIGQPDPVYTDTDMGFKVTGNEATQQVLRFTPRNIVVVYNVRVSVTGMHNVLYSRGVMTTAAPAKYLYSCQREFAENVGVLFDCVCDDDCIYTNITAFGLILGDAPGAANCNRLAFEFLLKNGTVHTETFDITDRLTQLMCVAGGVIDLSDIHITIEDVDINGGFDPKVEDWGEENVIKL